MGIKRIVTNDIKTALRAFTERVIDLPGVAGVGIGVKGDAPCLKVYLEDGVAKTRVPSTFKGFPVSVEKSGVFHGHF